MSKPRSLLPVVTLAWFVVVPPAGLAQLAPSATLTSEVLPGVNRFEIARSQTGRLSVVYCRQDCTTIYYRVLSENGTWSAPETVNTTPGPQTADLAIALDPSGTPHVFWGRDTWLNDEVLHGVRQLNGQWSESNAMSDQLHFERGRLNAAQIDADGQLHLATTYDYRVGGGYVFSHLDYAHGAADATLTVATIALAGEYGWDLDLALDSDRKPIFAVAQQYWGGYYTPKIVYGDGAQWQQRLLDYRWDLCVEPIQIAVGAKIHVNSCGRYARLSDPTAQFNWISSWRDDMAIDEGDVAYFTAASGTVVTLGIIGADGVRQSVTVAGAPGSCRAGVCPSFTTSRVLYDRGAVLVAYLGQDRGLRVKSYGGIITLPVNAVEADQHGYGWGDSAYPSLLAATFTGDGSDRLLHVQGYDIDSADELSVWLNGTRLGCLSKGANNALGTASLWWLPAAAQVAGVNRVEFRQKTAGEKWGLTGLGVYAPGTSFGNLKTRTGGDTTHGAGFELHLSKAGSGLLLGLSGYDSDAEDEIKLTLNGAALVNIPKGTNAAWPPGYQLPLPGTRLSAGDNLILIKNKGPATEDWGLRLDGLRDFAAPLGLMSAIPAAQQEGDRVSLLLPPSTAAAVLTYRCFDIDTPTEVTLGLDGQTVGNCPVTGTDTWGGEQRLSLTAAVRHLFVLDNRMNPPGTETWGLRLLGFGSDTDRDGVPDGSDNCPTTANPDQANLDGDLLGDACDPDLDGDGVANARDAFPRDRTEWVDTDGDQVGNNADVDDDNDGYPDPIDPFPLDARKGTPAAIAAFNPTTLSFLLDSDGSRGETAADERVDAAADLRPGDRPVRGDWNGDGRDELGVYRPSEGRFYLDLDGLGVWTRTEVFGGADDLPVAGDWDGDFQDEIGLYNPVSRRFTLDLDGSQSPTAPDVTTAPFGNDGDLPVIGDWNGDRRDDLGLWRPSTRKFSLDTNASRTLTAADRTTAAFGMAADRPVVGDWNGDHKDDLGVYRPGTRTFLLDTDGNFSLTTRDAVSAPFGPSGGVPLSGRW